MMYLVQTGKFIPYDKIKTYRNPENMSMFGRDGLVELNYMGSAEFEWGALPDSGFRIGKDVDKFVLKESGLISVGGVPLVVFAKEDEFDEAVKEIYMYIDDRSKTDQISKYRTKDPINLEYCMIDYYAKEEWKPYNIPNFWWDISNDFMFFIGAADRQRLFSACIKRYLKRVVDTYS